MKNILTILVLVYAVWSYTNSGDTKSKESLEKDCNSGNGRICMFLGTNEKKNYKKASEYYKKSCDYNYGSGCDQLVLLYENGYLEDPDHTKKFEYSKKSCLLGNALSCTIVSMMYIGGEGTSESLAKGDEFFHKGCDNHTNKVCTELKSFISEAKSYMVQ